MTQVKRKSIEDIEVVELANDVIEVAVMPGLGAKVISLVHRLTGREWMWKAPRSPQYVRMPTGSPFDQGPLAGADECLPTIAPCQWRGLDLPDHGEVWTEAWELDEAELDRGRIVTSLRLPISPLKFKRALSLEGSLVHFDYTLENLSGEPFEYLWAFHPMMSIEPGDRILLPGENRRVSTEACLGDCPLGSRGDAWDWPQPDSALDLSQLDLGKEGRAVKLFTEPHCEGYAAIRNANSGDQITFEFDPDEIDTLGIWINRGGFGGFHHVALEPTNGAPDALDVAVRDWKRFGCLEPGETKQWGFRIFLSIESSTNATCPPQPETV